MKKGWIKVTVEPSGFEAFHTVVPFDTELDWKVDKLVIEALDMAMDAAVLLAKKRMETA